MQKCGKDHIIQNRKVAKRNKLFEQGRNKLKKWLKNLKVLFIVMIFKKN